MRVSRIGLTPLKGTRHTERTAVELTGDGPLGDRRFCLVDRSEGRVLRTVENPSLLSVVARWEDGELAVDLPGATVTGVPEPTGERLELDYWGRPAAVEVVTGPWAAALSSFLGREVELARDGGTGEIVYAGPVSLVTTSSLALLEQRLGRPVAAAAFRATFVVDTGDEPAHVEDDWAGRRIRIGDAEVLVAGALPRCAVVDLDPVTGRRAAPVLATLAGYRRASGSLPFGVDAEVTRAGRVEVGDPVHASIGSRTTTSTAAVGRS